MIRLLLSWVVLVFYFFCVLHLYLFGEFYVLYFFGDCFVLIFSAEWYVFWSFVEWIVLSWVLSPLFLFSRECWNGGTCCLTSQLTTFQWYMWRHIDVQADRRRSWTYGRAPNNIDISQGSSTCPSKHRHRTNLFIRWFRHTALISRLLLHARDTEDTFSA